MDAARIERGEIGDGRVRADLAVDAVARFEAYVLALADFENRCDVGMIAVVAGLRFGGERLGAVDADGVHAMGPSGEHRRVEPTLPSVCGSTEDTLMRHCRT